MVIGDFVLFRGRDEVQGSGGGVDGGDLDLDFLSEFVGAPVGEFSSGLGAGGSALVGFAFFWFFGCTGDVFGADESFDEEVIELDEEAEVSDGGDDGVGLFTNAVGEHLKKFGVAEVVFGVFGVFFGLGAVLAEGGELFEVGELIGGLA